MVELYTEGGTVVPLKEHGRNYRAVLESDLAEVYDIERHFVGLVCRYILPRNDELVTDMENLCRKTFAHDIVDVLPARCERVYRTARHSAEKSVLLTESASDFFARFIEQNRFCYLTHD